MPKGEFQPPRGGSGFSGMVHDMYQAYLAGIWAEIATSRVKSGDPVEVAAAIADKFVAEYDKRNPTKAKPKFGL